VNRWTLLRSNLVDALRTMESLAGVTVEKIAQPTGVNAIPATPAIGVCRVGGRSTMPSEIGEHVNQPARAIFQIVVRCDNATETTAALEEAEEIATMAMQVRDTDIGIYGQGDALNTGGVFLDYQRDDVVAFAGREPGGAGPIALVITLQTTDIPI
jgi:hypothetical protein